MNTFSTNGSGSPRPGSQVIALAACVVAVIALIAAGMAFNAAWKSKKQIDELSVRADQAVEAQKQTATQVDNLAQNVQQLLNQIGAKINEMSNQIALLKTPPPPPVKTETADKAGKKAADGTTTETAAPPSGKTYTIKEGDTLGRVANRLNLKLADLEKANPGLNPNRMKIGQKINLP